MVIENACICKDCGRIIDRDFVFCPWCGESRYDLCMKGDTDAEDDRARHIDALMDRLDALDRELSVLELSVEMHR